ncbi:hypothetical protein [Zunongwangia sp.]|uniref:hypothetical protein n=1 Tax=Zunongwangia sp. TaxID=1965325 RepID=UPI003AA83630
MKNLFLFFALLIIFQPSFPIIEYVLNYNYISQELCVNKDRPELACNGKCYLMKSLANASDKKSQSKKENTRKKLDISLLFLKEENKNLQNQNIDSVIHSFNKQPDCYSFQNTIDFFRPPIS